MHGGFVHQEPMLQRGPPQASRLGTLSLAALPHFDIAVTFVNFGRLADIEPVRIDVGRVTKKRSRGVFSFGDLIGRPMIWMDRRGVLLLLEFVEHAGSDLVGHRGVCCGSWFVVLCTVTVCCCLGLVVLILIVPPPGHNPVALVGIRPSVIIKALSAKAVKETGCLVQPPGLTEIVIRQSQLFVGRYFRHGRIDGQSTVGTKAGARHDHEDIGRMKGLGGLAAGR